MSYTLQEFLADSTVKAAEQLGEAFLRLPEEKRFWQPTETSRTAQDQVAECIAMNVVTVQMIALKAMPSDGFETYKSKRAEANALDSEALIAQLTSSSANVAGAIRQVPDEALRVEVALPWGTSSFAEVIAFPYWNMTYHTGQINQLYMLLGFKL